MLESVIPVNAFLIQYCRSMLADLPDERFADQPVAGVNHPAWILGHLAWAADGVLGTLGAPKKHSPEWKALFGSGTKPTSTRRDYPSKDELIRAFEQGYHEARQSVAAATTEQLAQPTTNARAKDKLPTAKEFIAFLLTGHVGIHLGQLSAWRRLIGLAPSF